MDQKVIQTVLMRALDLDCIDLDRMHIVCITKNKCGTTSMLDDPRNLGQKRPQVMDLLNNVSTHRLLLERFNHFV